jgi:hypothetical protein
MDTEITRIKRQVSFDLRHINLAFDQPLEQTTIDILENIIKTYAKCIREDELATNTIDSLKSMVHNYTMRLDMLSNRSEYVSYSNYVNDLLDNYMMICEDLELFESCTNLRNIRKA